jgi:CHASE3 domain sensor protein
MTAALIATFVLATTPAQANDGAAPDVTTTRFIRKGQAFSEREREQCRQTSQATEHRLSTEAGGAENNTGIIVLAVIGALVLVGAVIYAVNKNNEKNNQ